MDSRSVAGIGIPKAIASMIIMGIMGSVSGERGHGSKNRSCSRYTRPTFRVEQRGAENGGKDEIDRSRRLDDDSP
jgi:hypothetical protein